MTTHISALRGFAAAFLLAAGGTFAAAQEMSDETDRSRPFEILDNSFLVEEAFNQERGVVQNVFVWSKSRSRQV